MSTFTVDYTTPHIPNWEKWLGHLKGQAGARMIEVGTLEGRSAIWFLENILTGPNSQLICIDPMRPLPEDNPHGPLSEEERRERWSENLDEFHSSCVLYDGWSALPYQFLKPTSLDAVYIDGCHEARAVCMDALMALPLLKPDGIMIFDDYRYTGPQCVFPPKTGIEAFLDMTEGPFVETLDIGYQLACKKIA